MPDDKNNLRKAVEIASSGIINGSGPFGAVITRDGKILSSASNRVVINSDPTAHAEILAIREAARILGTHDLKGCTLYTSCEPCPMCLGAIYWSGIGRVVYASGRRDAAGAGFDDEMIYNEMSLDPADRRIIFCHIDDPEAGEVFRKWIDYEGKRTY